MIPDAVFANPVALKDLRTLMRGRRATVLLCAYLLVVATPALVFLIRQSSMTNQVANGADLFRAVAVVQLVLILILTPLSVAFAIRTEHADGTWDLMVMTPLSAFQIVWGKFFTVITFQLLLAISALPLYAVALVYGEASPADLVRTLIVLIASILLAGALALIGINRASSYFPSVTWGTAIVLLLTGLLSLLVLGLGDSTQLSLGPLTFSPQLSRLAPLDPLAGLASALPRAGSVEPLASLQNISHPFGLLIGLPVWVAYCLFCLVVSAVLLSLASRGVGRKYHQTTGRAA